MTWIMTQNHSLVQYVEMMTMKTSSFSAMVAMWPLIPIALAWILSLLGLGFVTSAKSREP
jgi:hypothetical protein